MKASKDWAECRAGSLVPFAVDSQWLVQAARAFVEVDCSDLTWVTKSQNVEAGALARLSSDKVCWIRAIGVASLLGTLGRL